MIFCVGQADKADSRCPDVSLSLSLSQSQSLFLPLQAPYQLATNWVRRHVTAGPKHRLQVCLVAGLGGGFHCDALLLPTTNLP